MSLSHFRHPVDISTHPALESEVKRAILAHEPRTPPPSNATRLCGNQVDPFPPSHSTM